MGRPRERTMTNHEYKEVKALRQKQQEVSNQIIFGVAEFKIYSMLSNAEYRTKKRNEYKNVQYKLGEYKNGLGNMRKNRPDLYEKFWDMVGEFIEREFDSSYAPTIHRTDQHYEWETIDILTAKEHKDLDNAKPTIIRGQFVLGKKLSSKSKRKPLTLGTIRKVSEGKRFPSITKAVEYIENEFGITGSTVNRFIDTGNSIKTEKGSFEVLKIESKDKITEMKMKGFYEEQVKKFPQLPELMEKFRQYIERLQTPEGKRIHKLMMNLSKIKQKGCKLKKEGYAGLKIKWVC
jgi:hypothetical protein